MENPTSSRHSLSLVRSAAAARSVVDALSARCARCSMCSAHTALAARSVRSAVGAPEHSVVHLLVYCQHCSKSPLSRCSRGARRAHCACRLRLPTVLNALGARCDRHSMHWTLPMCLARLVLVALCMIGALNAIAGLRALGTQYTSRQVSPSDSRSWRGRILAATSSCDCHYVQVGFS